MFDDLVSAVNVASTSWTDSTTFNFERSAVLLSESKIVTTSAPTPACIPLAPPQLSSAILDTTGTIVEVTFDTATDQSGVPTNVEFDCGVIFELGGACIWISPTNVELDASLIAPGDSLILLADVITNACAAADCSCYETTKATELVVQEPVVSVVPVVVIQAPQSITICAGLSASVRNSYGAGGRDWTTIEWNATSDSAGEINDAQSQSEDLQFSVELIRELYDAGARTLTISCRLKNFFNESAVGVHSVSLTNDSRPVLEFVGGSGVRQLFRPNPFVISTYASPATPCGGNRSVDADLTYVWDLQVDDTSTDRRLQTTPSSVSTDSRVFALDAFSLQQETNYILSLTITDPGGASTTGTVKLEVLQSDIVARITGGNRSISLCGIDTISAAESQDPDIEGDSTGTLDFAWSCENLDVPSDRTCNTTAVDGSTQNKELRIINSELGFTNVKYTVTVTSQTRPEDVATDSIVIQHNVDPPKVVIDSPELPVLANERLVLTGTATGLPLREGGRFVNTTWSVQGALAEDQNLVDVARTELSASVRQDDSVSCDFDACASEQCELVVNDVRLLVNPGALVEGATYTFRLSATATLSSDEGFAELTIQIPRAPRGGAVSTWPSSGSSLETRFNISAKRWETDEPPLRYRFAVEGGQVLRVATEDSLLADAILPPGNPLVLEVYIIDDIGATTRATDSVVVSDSSAGIDEVMTLLEAAEVAGAYESTCNVAIAAALSDPKDSELLRVLVSAISEARELTDGTDEQTALFAACLAAVAADDTALGRDSAGVALAEIVGVVQDSGPILFSSDTAQNTLNVVSNLLDSPLFFDESGRRLDETIGTEDSYTATSASRNISSALDAFGRALNSVLVLDEFAVDVDASNVKVRARRNSGRDDVVLSTRSNAFAEIPEQGVAYDATLSELTINTHRLEDDGAGLSSTSVFRFELTALDDASSNATVLLALPTQNATPAPTTPPARDDFELECPWNFVGNISGQCRVGGDDLNVTVQCNGTKAIINITCVLQVDDACVTWNDQGRAWEERNCVRDNETSTDEITVCRCGVDFGSSDDETADDYSSRSVFRTNSNLLGSNFGGSIDVQRSIAMIIILCVYAVIMICLIYYARRLDKRDEKMHAAPTTAQTTAVETKSSSLELEESDDEMQGGGAPAPDAMDLDGQAESAVEADEHDNMPFGDAPNTSRRRRSLAFERQSLASRYLDVDRPHWTKRFGAALYHHHPFCSIWTVYSVSEPRWTRLVVVGLEILLVGASYAWELTIEWPDPNCSDRESEERCLNPKTWSRRHMCKWSEDDGDCAYRQPPTDSYKTVEHFYVVFVTALAVYIMLAMLQSAFRVICEDWTGRRTDTHQFGSVGAPPVADAQPASRPRPASQPTARPRSRPASRRAPRPASWVADRQVQFGVPPPATKRRSVVVRQLGTYTKPRTLRKQAEMRTPEVMKAVEERQNELRRDIEKAAAEGTHIGARKTHILYGLERDFVHKWGYTTNKRVFELHVFHVVLDGLWLAQRWEERIEKVQDEEQVKKLLLEYTRVSSLSRAERRIYDGTMRDGAQGDEARNDTDDATPQHSLVMKAIAWGAVAFFSVGPAIWLCIFASDVGINETINWLGSSIFLVAMIYLLALPLQIFVFYVALPALILDKLDHNPQINAASYPFETAPPFDAIDYFLELRPDLRPLMPRSQDDFVNELRGSSKEGLSVETLEEIANDSLWSRVSTVTIGLIFGSLLLACPRVIQDTIVGELVLLVAFGLFFALTGVTGDESEWNSAVLAFATLLATILLVVALTSIFKFFYNRSLRKRAERVRTLRRGTQRFIRHSSITSAVDFESKDDTTATDTGVDGAPEPPEMTEPMVYSYYKGEEQNYDITSPTETDDGTIEPAAMTEPITYSYYKGEEENYDISTRAETDDGTEEPPSQTEPVVTESYYTGEEDYASMSDSDDAVEGTTVEEVPL